MSHETEHKVTTSQDKSAHEIREQFNEKENPRSAKWGRGKQVGVAATILTALAVGSGLTMNALSGESKEAPEPGTRPTVEAPVVPGETPAPVETAEPAPSTDPTNTETDPSEDPEFVFEGDVLERAAMPDELNKYKEMSMNEFSMLPKNEQLTYASWLTSYRDDFKETFSTVSGFSSDEPFTVTPETSADKILAEISYNKRMAAYMTEGVANPQEGGTCGVLDEDAVTKTILAYTSPSSYNKPGSGFDLAGSILSQNDNKALCPSTLALLDYYSTYETKVLSEDRKEVTQDDGSVVTEVAIEYSKEGKNYHVGTYIIPTTAFNGETTYSVVSNDAYEIDS